MTRALQHPVLLPALALGAGVVAALLPLWRAGGLLVHQIQQAHALTGAAHAAQQARGWDFWTIEVDNLASELKEEKARLAQQSDALDRRAARLDAEQRELEKVRAGVEGLRQEIDRRVVAIRADEQKNLRTLAQTYTNLSPRAAVAIIHEMDDVTVVKILALMKPDVVAPIFEEMSHTPDKDGLLARRAAVLSERIRLLKSGPPAGAS